MNKGVFKYITFTHNFFWGLLLATISSGMSALVPLLIRNIIDLRSVLEHAFSSSILYELGILLILQAVLNSLGDFLLSCEGEKQVKLLRENIQHKLMRLPVNFFDNQSSGQLSSHVINDVIITKDFLTVIIPQTITGVVTIICLFYVLLSMDWRLTLMVLLIFPIAAIFTVPLGKFEEKITDKTQSSLGVVNNMSVESLRSIRSVKLNVAEEIVVKKFRSKLDELYKLSIKNDFVYAVIGPIQNLISLALVLGLVLYGGFRLGQGSLTIGTLTSFLICFYQLIGPFNDVAVFYTEYKQANGAMKTITKIMGHDSEDYEDKNYKVSNLFPFDLNLKNVTFSYDTKVVLKNINMDFPAKKKIAIVGPSGSGKSTIVNLITRLYSPDEGEVTLNDIDARQISLTDWRSLFGVVGQGNAMVSGTIYENLIFGLQEKPTDKDVQEALRVANLTEEVNDLKMGIDSPIGEQGVMLSGGQRQRIQIARAYLKHSKFLILDEATSNLDADSEKKVSDALRAVMQGQTIISIAHRLSTIVDADVIYFLNNHVIEGKGKHEQLIKEVPMYANFVKEQFISKE